MNVSTRMMRNALGVCALIATSTIDLFACTGFYVGPDASDDGTTLLARTVDSLSRTVCKRFALTDAVTNRVGRHYFAPDTGAVWPLPATTYKAVTVPSCNWEKCGKYEGACCNEKGVMLTGTVTGKTSDAALKADPFVNSGFGESTLPGLLIMVSATAREAVETLGRVIAGCGHHGAEIYMIADRDEAWYVEVYTGHQWAAVKMPRDKMLAIGNHFSLRAFDPSAPDTLSSEGLVSVPEKAGFLRRAPNGLIDLAETYAPVSHEKAAMRTWFARQRFAPHSTPPAFDRHVRLPLFFAPEKKVSVRDLQETMRWRYEGTGQCPDEHPELDLRVIGVGRQATCHVLTLDPTLPPATRCSMWVTLSNAEHAPFLPLNACVDELEHGFDTASVQSSLRFDPALPAAHFRRLSGLSELNRRRYGDGIRAYWRVCEDRWLAEYPQLVRKGDAAAITRYSVNVQRQALADAKRLFDELVWYILDQNYASRDYSKKTLPAPRGPFKPVQSNGDPE